MARAKLGFSGAASVDGFILVSFFFLCAAACVLRSASASSSSSKIGSLTTYFSLAHAPRSSRRQRSAAEREVPVGFGVGGALANGAAMLHGASLSQNAQRRSGGDAVEGFASRLRARGGTFGRDRKSVV